MPIQPENARKTPGYHVHPDRFETAKSQDLGRPVFTDERLTDPDDWYLITEGEITDQQYEAVRAKMAKKD